MLPDTRSPINSLAPSVPCLGPRQTVQTHIRRHRTRHLIRVYTVCLRNFYVNKSTPDTPKFGNGFIQLIRMEKSTRHIWINCTCSRCGMDGPLFSCLFYLSLSSPYEPPCDKTNKMACAPSEDSDQPGHPPSLIRVFTVRMKKLGSSGSGSG